MIEDSKNMEDKKYRDIFIDNNNNNNEPTIDYKKFVEYMIINFEYIIEKYKIKISEIKQST